MANEVLEFQHVPKGALFEHEGTTYQKIVVPASCWPKPKSIKAERSFGVRFSGDAEKLAPKLHVAVIF